MLQKSTWWRLYQRSGRNVFGVSRARGWCAGCTWWWCSRDVWDEVDVWPASVVRRCGHCQSLKPWSLASWRPPWSRDGQRKGDYGAEARRFDAVRCRHCCVEDCMVLSQEVTEVGRHRHHTMMTTSGDDALQTSLPTIRIHWLTDKLIDLFISNSRTETLHIRLTRTLSRCCLPVKKAKWHFCNYSCVLLCVDFFLNDQSRFLIYLLRLK